MCSGDFIQAASTPWDVENLTARFSPACTYLYPTVFNQYQGVLPSGLLCEKYPFAAMSLAFNCAACWSKWLFFKEFRLLVFRSEFVSCTNILGKIAACSFIFRFWPSSVLSSIINEIITSPVNMSLFFGICVYLYLLIIA